MAKKLQIRDLTLRDGQQSLFATRLKQENVDKLLPLYREAKFYIMEVWGGAVPDSVMRYLGESPWDRLPACSKEGHIPSVRPVARPQPVRIRSLSRQRARRLLQESH